MSEARGGRHGGDAAARLLAQTEFVEPVVLEAGAGTGKTATLVARICAWCLGPGWARALDELNLEIRRRGRTGDAADEAVAARILDGVVAITFTEAATAEMAARTGEAFAAISRGLWPVGCDPVAFPAEEPTRRSRARALLVQLDHLRVGTIHATCRRLLADWPLEAGMHPSFAVDADETQLAGVVFDVVEQALQRGLENPPNEDLLTLLAAGVGPESIAAAVTGLVRGGATEEALAVDGYGAAAVSSLMSDLAAAVARLLRILDEHLPPPAGTTPKVTHQVAAAVRALADALTPEVAVETVIAAVRATLPDNARSRLGEWRRGNLNKGESTWFAASADELAAAAGAVVDLTDFVVRLDPARFAAARAVLASLLAEVSRTMRRQGIATFDSLLAKAGELVRGHVAVVEREQARTTQLLVDEFQDTDPLQCELIRALAFGGAPGGPRPGLFLVGDPKQSIYGWRRADLAAYEEFVTEIGRKVGPPRALVVNFRSVRPILDEVERAIAPVMVEESGVQPPFRPLEVSPRRAGEPGHVDADRRPVEYWVPWVHTPEGEGRAGRTSVDGAVECEAAAVAADIARLHADHLVPWSHVGVLLRASSALEPLLAAFKRAGVPYAVERDRSYFRRREVIDAAALVRTVLDPADHVALVTWLRSPLVGVPDAALVPLWRHHLPRLLAGLGGNDGAAVEDARDAVMAAAREVPDVPGLDRVRGWEEALVDGLRTVASVRAAYAAGPPAEFVEEVRRRTLVEASEAARPHGSFRLANLDRLFRRLADALDAGAGVQEVLRLLRRSIGEEREAEEGRPPDAAGDAVRVMTIHKAKGLDFDHVYLLQACRASGRGDGPDTAAERTPDGWALTLLGVPAPGWRHVRARRSRVAAAELVRTLYVAMTRAKNRLVVSGVGVQEGRDTHAHLLAHRAGCLDLAAAYATAAAGGPPAFATADGVRWVFPRFLRASGAAARAAAVPLVGPGDIARQAEQLAALRAGAAARMARPWSRAVSADAHARLAALVAAEDPEVAGPRHRPREVAEDPAQRVATTVGRAVHAALEVWTGPNAEVPDRARARAEAVLAAGLGGRELAAARERAAFLLDRFAGSRLAERLAAAAPHVISRELPVLLPPDASPEGPLGVLVGTVDLVFRDPVDGAVVVVDFKTDAISDPDALAGRVRAYTPQIAAYGRAVRDALRLAALPRLELWFLATAAAVRVE